MGASRLTSHRAVFVDRDGVLNRNVHNPATGALEAPLTPARFELIPGVPAALAKLQEAGFLLFMVSNQPNYAKGKSSLATLAAIHRRLEAMLAEAHVNFAEFNYCLHHPAGVVPGYSGPCRCRKPSPYFLLRARNRFALDMRESWMIGDRLTDVDCGLAAGVRTILIGSTNNEAVPGHPRSSAYNAVDLVEAVKIVTGEKKIIRLDQPR